MKTQLISKVSGWILSVCCLQLNAINLKLPVILIAGFFIWLNPVTLSAQCPTITIDESGTNPTSCSPCNGTATATPSGGVAPYSYLWSTGATTQSIGTGDFAGTTHKHIDCGSPTQYISVAGDTFVNDANYFIGSTATFSITDTIANTSDDPLFRSERNCHTSSGDGTMTYRVPVTDGQYDVSLYFAELFIVDTVSKRKFDVFIEGVQVLDDYNIFAEVGAKKATIKTYVTTVTDDTLNIKFVNVSQRSKINGISVKPHHGSPGLCAGDYSVTVTDSNGCAATQTIELDDPAQTTNTNITICDGDSVFAGGAFQKTAGTYIDTYTGINGCDSIISTELSVDACEGPIDCQLSDWSDWSNCSATCGGGTRFRTKTILIHPRNGGTACGDTIEFDACNADPCPVDCQVSEWSEWSDCSVVCGSGTQTRTRTVIAPAQFGGAECPALEETRSCNDQPCPVDCQVGDWSDWGECSVTCGGGIQTRTRSVLVPAQFGGQACPVLQENQACNEQPCSVNCPVVDATGTNPTSCGNCDGTATVNANGGTSPYSYLWSTGETLQTIGEGNFAGTTRLCIDAGSTNQFIASTGDTFVADVHFSGGQVFPAAPTAYAITGTPDTAIYRNERNSGSNAVGTTLTYNIPVTNGQYDVTLYFAELFFTTANSRKFDISIEGTQVENDYDVFAEAGFLTAITETYVTTVSDASLSIVFTNVTNRGKINGICVKPHIGSPGLCAGSYSVTVTDSLGCAISDTIELTCEPDACQYGDWSDWSDCNVTCGDGTRYRTRLVLNEDDRAACTDTIQYEVCNLGPCPIDCVVSDWSGWGPCSVTCGGGTQTRTRSVLVPAQFGGVACPVLEETQACNTQPCPIDCQVSAWSDWTACSVACGGGTQSRTRSVLVPAQFGGTACPVLLETQSCNTQPCSACTLEVVSFTLINSSNEQPIGPLDNGGVINLFLTPNITIRADLCVSPIGSVKFVLNGSVYRVENTAPYALAGDVPVGNYVKWNATVGTYTLTGQPFSAPSAGGTLGTIKTITFQVINQQNVCVNNAACNDFNGCTTDTCIGGTCFNLPRNCNDNNACTADNCVAGACTSTPISCDDSNPCTIDICNSLSGCQHTNDPDCCLTSANCNDNDPCTVDQCADNICVHTPDSGHAYLKINNPAKSFRKLKLGYHPTNLWAPLQNVIAGGNTHLCVTLRNPAGDIEWNKIQIRTQSQGSAGPVTVVLSNYIFGPIPVWTTICIPLSDFTGYNFSQISMLEIPRSNSAGAFELHISKIEFTGGISPFLWFGEPKLDNKHNGQSGDSDALIASVVAATPCSGAPKLSNDESGIHEFPGTEEPYLNAYPNPFSEKVTIDFVMGESTRVKLEVIGIDGKKIATLFEGNAEGSQLNSAEFEAGMLANGMYFYRLIAENGEVYTKKLTLFR